MLTFFRLNRSIGLEKRLETLAAHADALHADAASHIEHLTDAQIAINLQIGRAARVQSVAYALKHTAAQS